MNKKTAYTIIVLLVIVNISLIAVNAIPAAKHQPKHYDASVTTTLPSTIEGPTGSTPTPSPQNNNDSNSTG